MAVNIEQIVAILLQEVRLGAFDLNDKKYGDDDLIVGSIDPYQLFRIFHELVAARRDSSDPVAMHTAERVVYMLDQCHNIEPKIPAMIRSVLNVQEATAKALLVDSDALRAAQDNGDVLGANAVLMDAFNTDVRPILAELREEMGIDPDPIAAYRRSGHHERLVAERQGGSQAGWGT
jgi:L-rhamnose isomerase/sugar isomerase